MKKIDKSFKPLEDLYSLLNRLEQYYSFDIEKEYYKRFSDRKEINQFCKYIYEKYKE